MLASSHFKIKPTTEDDWFDPILNADTELFVDPFLIFKDQGEFWQEAHSKIIGHFDRAFQLIAEGNLNPQTLAYRKALDLLLFTEPRELCLGYTITPARQAGYDALERVAGATRRLQIKGRCLLPGCKPSQRLGSIDITKDWDAVLLVLLDENFDAIAIYEAEREKVLRALSAQGWLESP